MEEQIIYGRWEYPIGNTPNSEIFEEYRGRSLKREDGIAIAGLDVAIRGNKGDKDRAAIILTYDRESDTFMKLYLIGKKNVQYKDCLKEKLQWEAELERRKQSENPIL